MIKKRLALVAASLLLVAARTSASPCEAVTSISEAVAAKHEFVLRGKVLRVRPPEAGTGIVPVMFSLIRTHRGTPPQVLTVYFDPRGDLRELSFHPGDLFAISAIGPESHAVGNACTLRKLVGVSR